jgi:hypothetical protein
MTGDISSINPYKTETMVEGDVATLAHHHKCGKTLM